MTNRLDSAWVAARVLAKAAAEETLLAIGVHAAEAIRRPRLAGTSGP